MEAIETMNGWGGIGLMEALSLILNCVLASGLVGTFMFFKTKRRQESAQADQAELLNTERIVTMQSSHIDRLDTRVHNLEQKVDKLELIIKSKDGLIETQHDIIRQAYRCVHPSDKCPVLIRRAEIEKLTKQKQNYE